jgi:hypothetical protein
LHTLLQLPPFQHIDGRSANIEIPVIYNRMLKRIL